MNKHTFIKQLREEAGFSQEKLAEELGMSRVSYIAVEKGEKDITLPQAEILSRMFSVSLDELQKGKRMSISSSAENKVQRTNYKSDKPTERIIMPRENVNKFKEVLLYILEKVGSKPNVGMTVLYKLLYFIDFDYYEKYETQIIGARYIKNTHGPTPVTFAKIVDSMKSVGDIEEVKSQYFQYDQKKFLPRRRADLSIFNGQEIAHIDAELNRLSDFTAVQISDLSHKDTPWLMAKSNEQLDYEYVFYRPEETSVRDYEQL